jgi:hypothetical protein
METTTRTVIMRRDPIEDKAGSRQLSLTCMLIICVYHELYAKELDLINKLSGKKFKIELINSMDNFQKFEDILFFNDDRVSNDNTYFSLKEENYTVSEKGLGVRFEVESANDEDGVKIWKGAIDGDNIEGVMIWARIGMPVESYTFNGNKI